MDPASPSDLSLNCSGDMKIRMWWLELMVGTSRQHPTLLREKIGEKGLH